MLAVRSPPLVSIGDCLASALHERNPLRPLLAQITIIPPFNKISGAHKGLVKSFKRNVSCLRHCPLLPGASDAAYVPGRGSSSSTANRSTHEQTHTAFTMASRDTKGRHAFHQELSHILVYEDERNREGIRATNPRREPEIPRPTIVRSVGAEDTTEEETAEKRKGEKPFSFASVNVELKPVADLSPLEIERQTAEAGIRKLRSMIKKVEDGELEFGKSSLVDHFVACLELKQEELRRKWATTDLFVQSTPILTSFPGIVARLHSEL